MLFRFYRAAVGSGYFGLFRPLPEFFCSLYFVFAELLQETCIHFVNVDHFGGRTSADALLIVREQPGLSARDFLHVGIGGALCYHLLQL